MVGLLFIGAMVFLIPGLDTVRGEPTPLSGWLRLMLGSILLVLAVWQWRHRPSSDDPVELPKALSKLDSISAGKTLAIGFSLSTFNPKNLLLTFAGAASIDASMATPTQQAIALFVYATVASLSVGIPIMGHILSAERFQTSLVDWRDWLIKNNTSVVIALLLVFGALIIGNGLKVLSV